jgi:hypothetical protein
MPQTDTNDSTYMEDGSAADSLSHLAVPVTEGWLQRKKSKKGSVLLEPL